MTTEREDRKVVEALRERLAASPIVGVIGLGYVGLPLAVAFAESGATVLGVDLDPLGVDLDPRRVANITAGKSFIEDVPSDTLSALVRAERLTAHSGVEPLKDADAVIICVPTPLGKSKEPDISFIVAAADAVAGIARRGQVIVLESTTYPGTESRGLEVGRDVFLAFSPERIDPGNRHYTLRNIPKVVGGLTPACGDLAAALYGRITPEVVRVASPATAEMIKLLENTFRSVNIALANEFAIMCRRLGISVWEVIRGASTKPFGFMPFYPGPGLGGHCLPSDPYYLSWKVRLSGYEPRFIAFADEINTQMPAYIVHMVTDALNDVRRSVRDSRILALGVAYKPNVADTRDSPALEIIDLLIRKGALVSYHDPFVPSVTVNGTRLDCVAWPADVAAYDAVVVLTAHAGYDWPAIVGRARLVLDTRNATKDVTGAAHLIRL